MKKRVFMDDGWAVWIEGEDTSTVYINEWLNPKGKSYIDVGIRIKEVKQSQKLSLYIPFSVSEEEIEDISEKLKDTNILCAVFSAGCLIDYKKNEYTSEVAYHGKTIDLIHCSGDMLNISPLASGTLVVVSLSELQDYIVNDEAYLLFRVLHKSLNEALNEKMTVRRAIDRFRDLVLSPVLTTRYSYSVRINEMRMLPSEITRIGAFHRQKLNKAVVTISVNEELYTVNTEYQQKLSELSDLNDDIANFLSSTLTGIIFVDNKLNIRRYTDYVTTEFSVMDHDIGRSLAFISYHFPSVDITEICTNVLKTLIPDEREVATNNNKVFFMRVAPYRSTENKILGCVITLMDITSQKQSQATLMNTEKRLSMAQQASDAKSDYLSRIAHEIRTPMSSLLSLAKTARQQADNKDRRACFFTLLSDVKKSVKNRGHLSF